MIRPLSASLSSLDVPDKPSSSQVAPPSWLAQKLEGWQAGLVAIGVAALGLSFAVPRAVPPEELPSPHVPASELQAAREREDQRASALDRRTANDDGSATFDLRQAGDLLRQIGRADRDKDRDRVGMLREKLTQSIMVVRRSPALGDEALAELRAFQERVFLAELARWEATGDARDELIEVGGDFLGLAERSGWITKPHRLLADDAVRGALFRKRFGEITGLRDGVFALTSAEQRHLLGFLLAHPPPGGAGPPIDDPVARARATDQWLLRKVDELAALDPGYPVAFAHGVLFYRLGDPAASALAFRAYLAKRPDGPYTLRARNHLRAAEASLDQAP